MEGSSTSSSSSCPSIRSLDDVAVEKTHPRIKFQYSYDGRILPRHSDGKLRYVGGHTRVLSVDRFISYTDLQVRLRELCGWGSNVNLRCQLPNVDLDTLVSVTRHEDLANVIEEYELAKLLPLKIRAFLHPQGPKSPKALTLPPVPPSTYIRLQASDKGHRVYGRCIHQISDLSRFQVTTGGDARYVDHGFQGQHQYLINNGNHWR